jgi:hypothetical protein
MGLRPGMDDLSAADLQIFHEKSRAFCGSFKIPLHKLKHENPPKNPRQFDEKSVLMLTSRFFSEDCLRHEADNHVPALIAPHMLPESAQDSRVGRTLGNSVVKPQFFDPPELLVYLHGRHRLEAARRFFDEESEQWWIVDLYSDGLKSRINLSSTY